jgi:hypothetical protein
MTRLTIPTVLGCSMFVAALAYPAIAEAGIEACGDIHVEAEAQCEVEVEGGCVAHCEPVRFEASCAAEL